MGSRRSLHDYGLSPLDLTCTRGHFFTFAVTSILYVVSLGQNNICRFRPSVTKHKERLQYENRTVIRFHD